MGQVRFGNNNVCNLLDVGRRLHSPFLRHRCSHEHLSRLCGPKTGSFVLPVPASHFALYWQSPGQKYGARLLKQVMNYDAPFRPAPGSDVGCGFGFGILVPPWSRCAVRSLKLCFPALCKAAAQAAREDIQVMKLRSCVTWGIWQVC